MSLILTTLNQNSITQIESSKQFSVEHCSWHNIDQIVVIQYWQDFFCLEDCLVMLELVRDILVLHYHSKMHQVIISLQKLHGLSMNVHAIFPQGNSRVLTRSEAPAGMIIRLVM